MIESLAQSTQTDLDVPQAFAVGQLCKGVRLQMVLDKLDQKLREGFRPHIHLFCLFSKTQSAILLPS